MTVLWRRWVHLLLGGALLMPYFLPAQVVTEAVTGHGTRLPVQFALLAACVPAIAVTGLAGPARLLSGFVARELLRVEVPAVRARSRVDRLRTATWCVVHLVTGGVVSAVTLAMPPLAVWWLLAPWRDDSLWWPPAGLALLAGIVALASGAGAALTRLAPVLLGPSAAERLVGLQQQVQEQAIRTRLARDLHDSLGHALSVISVQAGAGERRLADDPDFARAAFTAIQDAAYTASEELDRAIALLSAESKAHEPDLGDVDGLIRAVRDAGVEVRSRVEKGRVPEVVSRELYRVVQESLTNAVRHGAKAPVRVSVCVADGEVRVEVGNEVNGSTGRAGRGLRGMTERVTALGGEFSAGRVEDEWQVSARVPIDA